METDKERTARLEKMVATTQLRLALETGEERRDLIWIEIGVLKNKKNSRYELARPVMGTIFLVLTQTFSDRVIRRGSVRELAPSSTNRHLLKC